MIKKTKKDQGDYFRNRKLFQWNPNFELLLAIITLLLTWFIYYGAFNLYESSNVGLFLLFIIIDNTLINTLFPLWWITKYQKRPLSDLGITKNLLIPSILISLIFAIWKLIELPNLINGFDYIPQLIIGVLIFWEPFFVLGWLQTRYEKSFGIIPAIFLSALSFIVFQIGSGPLDTLFSFFPEFLILATAFALTKNIFVVWPIYWCVGSTVNELVLGMHYGWNAVAGYLIAIIIQFSFIYYLMRNKNA
ncbi:MAG TPA: hypothetical protein PLO25_03535 [Candidatus Saccharibacteria bacterium]|nr:hypothetical protein [Candidatus Saccharibacteria bacterium]